LIYVTIHPTAFSFHFPQTSPISLYINTQQYHESLEKGPKIDSPLLYSFRYFKSSKKKLRMLSAYNLFPLCLICSQLKLFPFESFDPDWGTNSLDLSKEMKECQA